MNTIPKVLALLSLAVCVGCDARENRSEKLDSNTVAKARAAPSAAGKQKVEMKKFTGTFQGVSIAKGQKSTILRAGDTEYLLRLIPSNLPTREDPEIENTIRAQIALAKATGLSRLTELARTGNTDAIQTEVGKTSQVFSFDDEAIKELARHLQVVEKLGLESGVQYVVEGFTVRDSSFNDMKWLVAKRIDGRLICTDDEALAQRVENPDYFKWAEFKAGVMVKYRTLRISGDSTEKGMETTTVRDADSETMTILKASSKIERGEMKERYRSVYKVPRYVVAAKKSAETNLESGTETFTSLTVNWVKTKTAWKDSDGDDHESVDTLWISDAVPGKTVKRTNTQSSKDRKGNTKTVKEVEELSEVTGPSTEAIAKIWQQHQLQAAQPMMLDIEKATTANDKLLAQKFLRNLDEILSDGDALRTLRSRANALPWPERISFEIGDGEKLVLVWIPPGGFEMGSASGSKNEQPVHKVRFTKGFYLGQTEVTEEQWKILDGHYVRGWKDNRKLISPKQPVDGVYVRAVEQWLDKLAERAGWPGQFRLPTESEWEYACRAGSAAQDSFGDVVASLEEYAWFKGNAGNDSHAVAEKKPNAWGLYDMHGNALEWCCDPYVATYSSDEVVDPKPHRSPDGQVVVRGGSWRDPPEACRSAYRSSLAAGRYARDPDVGFRVVFQTEFPKE